MVPHAVILSHSQPPETYLTRSDSCDRTLATAIGFSRGLCFTHARKTEPPARWRKATAQNGTSAKFNCSNSGAGSVFGSETHERPNRTIFKIEPPGKGPLHAGEVRQTRKTNTRQNGDW
uniref:Uncharacterized protein n=1 Tax=Anopheles farauti TaxID=69004 RepID=A0A182QRF2_9DIPT